MFLLGGILTGWFMRPKRRRRGDLGHRGRDPSALQEHIKRIPFDFRPRLADLAADITIGAANAFGWMLAYLRGAIVIARELDHLDCRAKNVFISSCSSTVLLFHGGRGLHRAGSLTIIIFMPLVNALTQAGDINGVTAWFLSQRSGVG